MSEQIDDDIVLIKEVNKITKVNDKDKSSSVSNIAFHSRLPILANGSYSDFDDRSVQFFNVPNLVKVGSIEWGAQKVNCVAFHPRLDVMLTGDANSANNVKLLNVTIDDNDKLSANELMTLGGHTQVITCIAFHSTQPFFATGSWDKQVKIWHYNEKKWYDTKCILSINHDYNVTSIAFHPTQHIIATASRGSGAKMLDFSAAAADATEIATPRIIDRDITLGEHIDTTCVAFHPGPINFILAVGGHEYNERFIYSIKLWDYSPIKSLTCVATLTGHTNKISSMVFHPSIPLLVSGSDDGTVKFWCIEDDIKKTTCCNTVRYSSDGFNRVTSIAIYPHNNSLLATGTFNGWLRLYNIANLMSKLSKINPFYIKPSNVDNLLYSREISGNKRSNWGTAWGTGRGGNNKNRNTNRNRHKLSRKRHNRTFRKKRKSHNRR